ncbi:fork head domain-containing protein [Chlamydoabsidia padenii]|nr:fork head domain-containing protein [Chlamydoabsidia padenii]
MSDLHLPDHQSLQQGQINHHHPFATTTPAHFSSPMFYNTSDNNTMYYQQQQQPPPPAQQPNQREAAMTEVLKPRPMRKRRRPPHSYASLIAQAILTSQEQKMTLREIYEWVQTRYPHLYEANETGWQNTIRHNLSLNRCFRKVARLQDNGKKGTKGGYWTVDIDQLNNTSFGRQILDSGFLGSIEYWHQEQEQQQQQRQCRQVLAPSLSTSTSNTSMTQKSSNCSISSGHIEPQSVEEIDFNSLVPFYSTTQEQGHYTTIMDPTKSEGYFGSRLKRSYDGLQPDISMASTSSKTSSVRGSTSPGSPETDHMNTPPIFQSLTHYHQQRQQQQQQQQQQENTKLDLDPLLNPSLMRVNNILN